MTKQTLIVLSVIADLLDLFVLGQIPGLSWFVDIPLVLAHVSFAGSKGWLTMLEIIPFAGTFPVFTIAGMLYPKPPKLGESRVEVGEIIDPSSGAKEQEEMLLIPCLNDPNDP